MPPVGVALLEVAAGLAHDAGPFRWRERRAAAQKAPNPEFTVSCVLMHWTVADAAPGNRFDDKPLADVQRDVGPRRVAGRGLRRPERSLNAFDDRGHRAAVGLDEHEIARLPIREVRNCRGRGPRQGGRLARRSEGKRNGQRTQSRQYEGQAQPPFNRASARLSGHSPLH